MSDTLDQLCINTIRFLSVDAVQKANSGHPGLPLGSAPTAYALWTRVLKHNPRNPLWFDRDRFVLSAGHGSMLLYSLLHLTGYALPLDEITRFRQWGSKAPGHPERGLTPGVETTTGPLGQGFANAVGMAIAEAQLAARYNRHDCAVIDHATYVLASDGDLMEGVASEAASLAGHLRLGKLTCLYADNRVTLAAGTDITFSEDRAKRFQAYGWHTVTVADGGDLAAIDTALHAARADTTRPSLVLVRTHIGYGSPHKQDSFEAHGSPLGTDEVRLTKQHLGWPVEPLFLIPEPALAHFREALESGARHEAAWNDRMTAYAQAYPDLAQELRRSVRGELPPGWDADMPTFPADPKGIATRVASGKVMNAVAPRVTALVGGSADLDPSTHTALNGFGDFNPPAGHDIDTQGSSGGGWSYAGRNLHAGVREHAMGAIVNGMAAQQALRRGRHQADLGAAGDQDQLGIGIGRIEQDIRAAPQAVSGRVTVAIERRHVLPAQDEQHRTIARLQRDAPRNGGFVGVAGTDHGQIWNRAQRRELLYRLVGGAILPQRDAVVREHVHDVQPHQRRQPDRRAHVVGEDEEGRAVRDGSPVHEQGIAVRCVSMPSWELFEALPQAERDLVLPPSVTARLAVELGVRQGWERYTGGQGDMLGVERFGASAPGEVLLREFGFTVDNVCARAKALLRQAGSSGGRS